MHSEGLTNVVAATDWVGRPNVFYTENRFSLRFNDLVEDDFTWDAAGLYNYLDWGFSVFERTPVAGIKFLPPNADLVRGPNGKLFARPRPEPDWLTILHTPTRPDDVLHLLHTTIRNWESSVKGEIVLPLSGGYDSRLIGTMLAEPSRVMAFSYGAAFRQERSKETVVAREIAKRLGIGWRQVELGDYHRYFDEWHALFGAATHAHGMYHMEFYRKVAESTRGPLASGLVGDAWAGKTFPPVHSPAQLSRLKLTHGMHADVRAFNAPKPKQMPQNEFFQRHETLLKDARYNVVAAVRLKMTLLQYLEEVPRALGFAPFSPLCTLEAATAMLALPQELRKNRTWQTDFFRAKELLPENDGLKFDRRNDLIRTAWNRIVPRPLSEAALADVVRPEYVRKINRVIARPPGFLRYHFFQNAMRLAARYGKSLPNPYNTVYFAYLTLHPLDIIARKRRSARFLSP